MRILLVHNHYNILGGEDTVFANERDLLRGGGHDVETLEVDNSEIVGTLQKLKIVQNLKHSPGSKMKMQARLSAFKPDIVHVHNIFPKLSASVIYACNEMEIPVVQTLHNFRHFCANGLLMRDGKICETCLHQTPYWGAARRCYRGSFAGSLAVASMINHHARRGTWANCVDGYIALTQFSRSKFIEGGIPAHLLHVKPNFAQAPKVAATVRGEHALFVGRLSQEKGVEDLLAAWEGLDIPLRIAGDGPLDEELRARAPKQVTLLGRRTPDEIASEMAKAAFLVAPSRAYENFPMVAVEAFSSELPVLAPAFGAFGEVIRDGLTGRTFAHGDVDDLRAKANWLAAHKKERGDMGRLALAEYAERYTPEINLNQLIEIYEAARAAKIDGVKDGVS